MGRRAIPRAAACICSNGPSCPAVDERPTLVERWAELRALREQVTEAIEPLRREKVVGSSLEAEVDGAGRARARGLPDADLAELFITAAVTRGDGDEVTVTRTDDTNAAAAGGICPK